MKSTLLKYGTALVFLVLSATMLMHISGSVQQLERDITRYDRSIEQEKEKIRVLKAEWAYLNNPERLEILAAGGYDMQMPGTDALVSDPARLSDIIISGQDVLASGEPCSGDSTEDKLDLHPQTQGSAQ